MLLCTGWRDDAELSRGRGWARVHADGLIVVNKHARLTADEWTWVIAHCALHVGFGHVDPSRSVDPASLAGACAVVTRFQQQLRLGTPPGHVPADLPGADEGRLAELWQVTGVPGEMMGLGCGGTGPDHVPGVRPLPRGTNPPLSWTDSFAVGLAAAAGAAVYEAGETRARQTREIDPDDPWEKERRWFVTAFPLLGALAAGFRIVADADLARSWQISIAAVDAELAEIYVNPLHGMTPAERRFVLAHEMLHAALRHAERVGWRDPYLWNVAADFVVNGWLVEMGVGEMPTECLYDPSLRGRGVEDAIASYAVARDVPAAWVVFCDAVAYDAGYLPVEEIAGRVRVRGRGGTALQPGISLLERAEDFPPDGPILVITDGRCDVLRVRREHAFLIPKGASLPFATRAEVFRISFT
jgi:hypothetical protein